MECVSSCILIVDDEPGIRDLFTENLGSQGYVCLTASNGQEALQILGSHPVDLVLLDVVMPGMTGPTLFQNLEERYPDVAVIFITAIDDLNLAVEYLKSGAYDYIVKPVSLIRLLRAVETSLEKHRGKFEDEQQSTHLEHLVVHQSQALRNKQREITALNHMIQHRLRWYPKTRQLAKRESSS